MGKRSDFPRKERDFYPTPESAVLPLLPHLGINWAKSGPLRYTEPCAGDGALIDHLRKYGAFVDGAYDIEPRAGFVRKGNAFDIETCYGDMFITNPPWPSPGSKGEPTVSMAKHLSSIAPTWFLLSADFAHNKYFTQLHCAKIVSVGRVSWEQNGVGGKDNCAWYLFVDSPTKTEFFGRE